eukprot:245719-Hanusia_phi.AAC.5
MEPKFVVLLPLSDWIDSSLLSEPCADSRSPLPSCTLQSCIVESCWKGRKLLRLIRGRIGGRVRGGRQWEEEEEGEVKKMEERRGEGASKRGGRGEEDNL